MKKRINVYVDQSDHDKVKEYCEKRGWKVAFFIREAVKEKLALHRPGPKQIPKPSVDVVESYPDAQWGNLSDRQKQSILNAASLSIP